VKAFLERDGVKPVARAAPQGAAYKWLGAYKAGNGFQTPREHKQ